METAAKERFPDNLRQAIMFNVQIIPVIMLCLAPMSVLFVPDKVFVTVLVCYSQCMTAEPSIITDQILWQNHCQGVDGSFDELVRRHQRKLEIYVHNRGKNVSASIDDIIQTVLIKASQAGNFDGSNFPGFLIRIAGREIINAYRLQKKKQTSEWIEETTADSRSINGLALLLEREASQEKRVALRECLQSVNPTFVRIFVLLFRDGMSGVEIAKQEGIAEGTVHSRTKRAKEALKVCIEGKLS